MIALAATGAVLAACGGGASTPGEFDPGIAEEFIRNMARADIQSNPALTVQEPQDPEVDCSEESPDNTDPAEATRFRCDVRIVDAGGKKLGTESWEALVVFDSTTGESIVRETKRLQSSIDPAPQP
jgi:hypothetical protein